MKISNFRSRGRRAISPIVATVLIVAVTLVASVAIAEFVFGIFSTQSNTAQVSVTAQALLASTFLTGGTAINAVCNVASGANQMPLSNTVPAAAPATADTIPYAGP